jgi:hypothetical protein
MLWHLAFGIEAGLDALVSPTHLLLLTGGTLLLTSPLRAAAATDRDRWPAVVSMAAATSLAGFFLSYVSVFADPGAREPLHNLPTDLPEHRAAELPVIAARVQGVVATLLVEGVCVCVLDCLVHVSVSFGVWSVLGCRGGRLLRRPACR